MNGDPASGSNAGGAGGNDGAIGARLRDARIARKLKPEEVARALHLDVEVIRALESGDMAALPAPIFVQGYVRSYARLVGLPEAELMREYSRRHAEPPPLSVIGAGDRLPLFRLPSARLVRRVILVMLGLILLWLAYPLAERLVVSRGAEPVDESPGRLELPPRFADEPPRE